MRRAIDFILGLGWTGNATVVWILGLLLIAAAFVGLGSDRLGLYGILVAQLGGALLLWGGGRQRWFALALIALFVANVIAFVALDRGLFGPNVAIYYAYERSALAMLLWAIVSGIWGGWSRRGQAPSLIGGAAVGVVVFVFYIGMRQVIAVPDHVVAAGPIILRVVAPRVIALRR